MGIASFLPLPVKRRLRPVKQYLLDQQQRSLHRLRSLLGQDVWIRPRVQCDRQLLGHNDGEWCICPSVVPRGAVVYSFGVGRDISFDRALIEQFDAEVHAFDPTPISMEWLKQQAVPAGFHFHPYGIGASDGVAKFALPTAHGVSFTMLPDIASKAFAEGEICRLPTILARLGHPRIHILKMDIEGAEYDVIPEVVAAAERIDQLLIEFHHRLLTGPGGVARTRQALASLSDAGFRLFYVSPRGLEYCFIR